MSAVPYENSSTSEEKDFFNFILSMQHFMEPDLSPIFVIKIVPFTY